MSCGSTPVCLFSVPGVVSDERRPVCRRSNGGRGAPRFYKVRFFKSEMKALKRWLGRHPPRGGDECTRPEQLKAYRKEKSRRAGGRGGRGCNRYTQTGRVYIICFVSSSPCLRFLGYLFPIFFSGCSLLFLVLFVCRILSTISCCLCLLFFSASYGAGETCGDIFAVDFGVCVCVLVWRARHIWCCTRHQLQSGLKSFQACLLFCHVWR